MSAFANIARPSLSPPSWHQQREVVARLADAIDTTALLPAIADALSAAFDAERELPDVEQLDQMLPSLADAIAQVPETARQPREVVRGVRRRIVNAGLARFLAQGPFDPKRIATVAELERDLDWQYLPVAFARELQEPVLWVEAVLRSTFSLEAKDSEDDRELLEDEKAKWKDERKREVPCWRAGNIMSLGTGDFLLLSAVLRRLDEVAWLRLLDKQEIPGAVATLIWHAQLERDPASILRLLGIADPAFGENGERTGSVSVYFMVEGALSLVEKDLEQRVDHRLGAQEVSAEVAKQDDLLRDVVDAMRSRTDSNTLLVEVGADYLVRAQVVATDSASMQRRSALYQRFVDIISEQLGPAEAVVGLAGGRAARQGRSTCWGLWLLAVNASCMKEAQDRGKEIRQLRQDLWDWLITLMSSKDKILHDRYCAFPGWVVAFVGYTLVRLSAPLVMLDQAWTSLRPQRLERVENRFEKDTWRLSKLVCRAGFYAARVAMQESNATLAMQLWRRSIDIAITGWLFSASNDAFADVHLGLCHLAAGRIEIEGEPARTLAYLRGEPTPLTQAAIALTSNGMAPADVARVCADVGIDALAYMQLANANEIANLGDLVEQFRNACSAPSSAPR
jgi:hypothetical protein